MRLLTLCMHVFNTCLLEQKITLVRKNFHALTFALTGVPCWEERRERELRLQTIDNDFHVIWTAQLDGKIPRGAWSDIMVVLSLKLI